MAAVGLRVFALVPKSRSRSMLRPALPVPARKSADGRRRHRVADANGSVGFSARAILASVEHIARSEEHTSELQSRRDLVCRLLLEKKKKRTLFINSHHTCTLPSFVV